MLSIVYRDKPLILIRATFWEKLVSHHRALLVPWFRACKPHKKAGISFIHCTMMGDELLPKCSSPDKNQRLVMTTAFIVFNEVSETALTNLNVFINLYSLSDDGRPPKTYPR